MEEDEDGYHFEEGDTVDELETSYSYTSTTFLKVLCILTWVYAAISAFLFIIYYGNSNNVVVFSNGIGDNVFTYLIFSYLFLPIVCAIGSIFMFLRNKWGFVIYLFGQLPPIIYAAYKLFMEGGLNALGLVPFMLTIAVPVGFIIMYSTQLYVMRPVFNKKVTEL